MLLKLYFFGLCVFHEELKCEGGVTHRRCVNEMRLQALTVISNCEVLLDDIDLVNELFEGALSVFHFLFQGFNRCFPLFIRGERYISSSRSIFRYSKV